MLDLDHIAPELRHLATPVAELFLDAENARTHGPENVQAIRESLLEFGQDQPIVYRKDNRTVVKGNGRLMAARELGWEIVAAIGIDDDEVRALHRGIVDNRASDIAGWNGQQLAAQMKRLREAGVAIEAAWAQPAAIAAARDALAGQEPEYKGKMRAVAVTEEQMTTIMEAVNKLRVQEGKPDMSVGRGLELLAAEWLSGWAG